MSIRVLWNLLLMLLDQLINLIKKLLGLDKVNQPMNLIEPATHYREIKDQSLDIQFADGWRAKVRMRSLAHDLNITLYAKDRTLINNFLSKARITTIVQPLSARPVTQTTGLDYLIDGLSKAIGISRSDLLSKGVSASLAGNDKLLPQALDYAITAVQADQTSGKIDVARVRDLKAEIEQLAAKWKDPSAERFDPEKDLAVVLQWSVRGAGSSPRMDRMEQIMPYQLKFTIDPPLEQFNPAAGKYGIAYFGTGYVYQAFANLYSSLGSVKASMWWSASGAWYTYQWVGGATGSGSMACYNQGYYSAYLTGQGDSNYYVLTGSFGDRY